MQTLNPLNITTIIGARPQFIKAAAMHHAIAKWNANSENTPIHHTTIHTGQHYDDAMSEAFFREFGLPAPEHNLGIANLPPAELIPKQTESLKQLLEKNIPDWVLVYGDTYATLSGALAAHALGIRVAHVEAGLRSFNNTMTEEKNRIETDRISTLLFCPTAISVYNLKQEGITKGVYETGDIMFDVAVMMQPHIAQRASMMKQFGLIPKSYILATCHRAENTDNAHRLSAIISALQNLTPDYKVLLSLHPRTRAAIAKYGINTSGILCLEPLSYSDITQLLQNAALLATDSGGMQKEAYFHKVPCVTLRDETEWVETVSQGANRLASPNDDVLSVIRHSLQFPPKEYPPLFGDGQAATRILQLISQAT